MNEVGDCNYNGCTVKATTKGTVFTKKGKSDRLAPVTVNACDKHKKLPSFFPKKNRGERYVS
ncbi:hypothetical protein B5G50_08195 [Brevibacillus brevis]|nr:hypothetical protein B5G50_08195 [Brevibacillus brevis]